MFSFCTARGSGRALRASFAVAARGLAARGYNVTFLAEPHSNVEQSASRMATVASKIGGDDPVARREVAPFEIAPFSCEGNWFGAAWRLRHLFRRWDADVVFVHTEREHLIAVDGLLARQKRQGRPSHAAAVQARDRHWTESSPDWLR